MAFFNNQTQGSSAGPMLRNPFLDQVQENEKLTADIESMVTDSTWDRSAITAKNLTQANTLFNAKPRRDSVISENESNLTEKIRGLNIQRRNTIGPMDSASQVNPGGRIHTQLSSINEFGDCMFNEVIGGYAQTADEKLDELDAVASIQKVTGLPVIFTNMRLNFLVHLHKPLQKMLSKDDKYPVEDSLHKISGFVSKYRGKQRTSHDDLLYQVIRATFKENKVRANPFNLPLLEVGMMLSDKLIFMSFVQLYNEYQIEWFKSMKDIDAPKFHNKFKNFKGRLKDAVTHRPENRRRHTSGSVLSGLGL